MRLQTEQSVFAALMFTQQDLAVITAAFTFCRGVRKDRKRQLRLSLLFAQQQTRGREPCHPGGGAASKEEARHSWSSGENVEDAGQRVNTKRWRFSLCFNDA